MFARVIAALWCLSAIPCCASPSAKLAAPDVWVGGRRGAYHWDGHQLRRIRGVKGWVDNICRWHGRIFLSGAYGVQQGDGRHFSPIPVRGKGMGFHFHDDELWLCGDGIFRWNGRRGVSMPLDVDDVSYLTKVRGELCMRGYKGATNTYSRWKCGHFVEMKEFRGKDLYIETVGAQTYIGIDRKLFRWDGNAAVPCITVPSDICRLTAAGGELWIFTHDTLYRFDGKQLVKVDDLQAICLFDVKGDLWLNADMGTTYHWVDGKMREVPEIKGNPWCMVRVGEELWIGAQDGLYHWDGHRMRKFSSIQTAVTTILPVGKEVWLGTDRGVYRWDGRAFHDLMRKRDRICFVTVMGKGDWQLDDE